MLSLTAFAVIRLHQLFWVVMLFGIYSLLSALLFVVLDAVDVAFTEAAVGAGIATVLMLATLLSTGRHEKKSTHNSWLPLLVVFLTGAGLVWGTLDMPGFGEPYNPVHMHVADRYIGQSGEEIGIPNIVTSVLASYRGYDTMGEVIVVFTALVGVLSLINLRTAPTTPAMQSGDQSERPYPILQIMAIILIPFILVFAFYVQFHGDFGPGGGFQAGVILASGIVLYTLTFGYEDAIRLVAPKFLLVVAALGVLVYGGTGVASMMLGGNFLDYDVLAHDPVHGQHLGIIVIELGVGMTVSAVMAAIFFAFVSRSETHLMTVEDENLADRRMAERIEEIKQNRAVE